MDARSSSRRLEYETKFLNLADETNLPDIDSFREAADFGVGG
jgi:hypothetical protein